MSGEGVPERRTTEEAVAAAQAGIKAAEDAVQASTAGKAYEVRGGVVNPMPKERGPLGEIIPDWDSN